METDRQLKMKTLILLKEASEDYKQGRDVSPTFSGGKSVDAYLDALS